MQGVQLILIFRPLRQYPPGGVEQLHQRVLIPRRHLIQLACNFPADAAYAGTQHAQYMTHAFGLYWRARILSNLPY
jgi:hypothetical protein